MMGLKLNHVSKRGHSTVTLNTRNDVISIHQSSVRANEGKITLILSDCVMNGFITSGIKFMTAPPSQYWHLDSFSVLFRDDVRGDAGLREFAWFNRRTQLRNGHVADLKNYASFVGRSSTFIWLRDTGICIHWCFCVKLWLTDSECFPDSFCNIREHVL